MPEVPQNPVEIFKATVARAGQVAARADTDSAELKVSNPELAGLANRLHQAAAKVRELAEMRAHDVLPDTR